jgi:hypothetical protein
VTLAAGTTDRSSNGVNGHNQQIAVVRPATLEGKGTRVELSQHRVSNRVAGVGQASAPSERLVTVLPLAIDRNVDLRLIEVVGMVPGPVRIERTDRTQEVRAAARIATAVTTLATTAAQPALVRGRLGLPMVTGLRTAIGFSPTVQGVERGAGRLVAIASMMEVALVVAAAKRFAIVNHVVAVVVLALPNIPAVQIVLPVSGGMVETVRALG